MATKSFNQSLVVNGTSNGLLTVSDSSGFEVGATVFLAAKDERVQQLKVSSKPSPTSVMVVTPADALFDASAFTVAKEAKLFQPKATLLVPSSPVNTPPPNTLVTSTTTIAVPNNPELVLNGDTGNVLVINKNGTQKALIDVDGLITAAGIKFPDNTTQTTASVGGGGGSGGGWTTAREIDFTALSNQTLATTTTYNLGGLVWDYRAVNTRENTVLTNGTGIVFKPNSSAKWWAPSSALNNSPELWIKLTDLIPDWNPHKPIRFLVQAEVQGTVASGGDQEFIFGVELRGKDNSRVLFSHLITSGYENTNPVNAMTPYWFYNGTASSYPAAKRLPLGSKNVLGIQFHNTMLGGPVSKFGGTYTTGWPTKQNIDVMSYDEYPNAENSTLNLGYYPKENFYLYFVAYNDSASSSATYTLKRLKIETKDF